jgi:transcriptional regulator with XRE-family HTH domain
MKHRIKEILKEKGLTVVTLAKNIGITQPNMSNIINEKTNPSIETLEKIATALNVAIAELFQHETELYGLVMYNGKTYKIDSEKSIMQLYNEVIK